MAIKYTNIFTERPSKMCPNYDFWSENKPSGNPALVLPAPSSPQIRQFVSARLSRQDPTPSPLNQDWIQSGIENEVLGKKERLI
jgi:hypothetical protein